MRFRRLHRGLRHTVLHPAWMKLFPYPAGGTARRSDVPKCGSFLRAEEQQHPHNCPPAGLGPPTLALTLIVSLTFILRLY